MGDYWLRDLLTFRPTFRTAGVFMVFGTVVLVVVTVARALWPW